MLKSRKLPTSARIVMALLEKIEIGSLHITDPNGRERLFIGKVPGPEAKICILDWSVFTQVLTKSDIGLGETYRDGLWTSDDVAGLIGLLTLNQNALENVYEGQWHRMILYRLVHLLRPNTRRGSSRNIHAHYDVGNDFYRLWLDPTMTYSSGLFEGKSGRTLNEAQLAKYERILQTLNVRAGDHILEIGCGWGGFAEYAAKTRACKVKGITISKEQHAWANRRIADAGLSEQVTIELCDYRDLQGKYDHIVSIEMLEAVGEKNWPLYFQTIRKLLRSGGTGLVQTIVMNDRRFDVYRKTTDFIQQYVFPGGLLPCPRELNRVIAETSLTLESVTSFGEDYAETLRQWDQSFTSARNDILKLGHGEGFFRLWKFYFAYCQAGFQSRHTDVLHLKIAMQAV